MTNFNTPQDPKNNVGFLKNCWQGVTRLWQSLFPTKQNDVPSVASDDTDEPSCCQEAACNACGVQNPAEIIKSETIISDVPSGVQADIDTAKALFQDAELEESVDPNYDRIIAELENVVKQQIEEEKENPEHYLFNHEEFVNTLDHIVKDQLSALKKEKLSPTEFAERFNRWFVFCDAVVNLGISCLYSADAIKQGDYETVFKSLKINKQFETAFLKPRGIKIALTHKSEQVRNKYPWLAMPCLVIKDAEGTEHLIAITPSPVGAVWWLDILVGFHNSYQWAMESDVMQKDFEESPYPTLEEGGVDIGDDNEEEEKGR